MMKPVYGLLSLATLGSFKFRDSGAIKSCGPMIGCAVAVPEFFDIGDNGPRGLGDCASRTVLMG